MTKTKYRYLVRNGLNDECEPSFFIPSDKEPHRFNFLAVRKAMGVIPDVKPFTVDRIVNCGTMEVA